MTLTTYEPDSIVDAEIVESHDEMEARAEAGAAKADEGATEFWTAQADMYRAGTHKARGFNTFTDYFKARWEDKRPHLPRSLRPEVTRELREAGMSQTETAAVEGVSQKTVSNDDVSNFTNVSTRTDSLGREQPTRKPRTDASSGDDPEPAQPKVTFKDSPLPKFPKPAALPEDETLSDCSDLLGDAAISSTEEAMETVDVVIDRLISWREAQERG